MSKSNKYSKGIDARPSTTLFDLPRLSRQKIKTMCDFKYFNKITLSILTFGLSMIGSGVFTLMSTGGIMGILSIGLIAIGSIAVTAAAIGMLAAAVNKYFPLDEETDRQPFYHP